MANILTLDEGARVLRLDPSDELLADILPQVDALIKQATGKDWALDNPVHPLAKRAATCRIAIDFDLASMSPSQISTLERAYIAAVTSLEEIKNEEAVV